MNNIDLNLLYQKTLEVLKLAAAPASIQLQQFPEQTCRPDEVALTYDEVISNVDLLLEGKLITTTLRNRLKEVNDFYSTFKMGEDGDWTEQAMFTSVNWQKSRQLAENILSEMHIQKTVPNLFWVRFVC